MTNDRQRLGRQLAAARKARAWNLADVARRTGRDAGRVSEMENGKSNSTVDSLTDAGNVLGMKLVFVPADKLEDALSLSGHKVAKRETPAATPSVLQEVFLDDSEPDDGDPCARP